jgi:hypothetical protein
MRKLVFSLLMITLVSVQADPPRTLLKAPPRIGSREFKELVLTGSVTVDGGKLGPGGPTSPHYTIRPGRFVPVSEDEDYIYCQAQGGFAEGMGQPGGLRLHKTFPDVVDGYLGNANYPKMELHQYLRLDPAAVRKIRVQYAKTATNG